MGEFLLFASLIGLVLASDRRMGLGNPFQIYFLVWAGVWGGFCMLRESFLALSFDFLLLMAVAKGVALLLLVVTRTGSLVRTERSRAPNLAMPRDKLLLAAQIAVLVAAPLTYLKANELAGSESIFTVSGYVRLRASMTQYGEGYGLLAYVAILSYIVTSLTVVSFLAGRAGWLRLVLSVSAGLFYVYVGTARTGVLLLLVLVLLPLVLSGKVKLKGMVISVLVFCCMVVFSAGMTAKGISVEGDLLENMSAFATNVRSYTIAPLLALSQLIDNNRDFEWGINTFRFFFAASHALGVTDSPPVAKEYAFVPDATNVYTVYEIYFRDIRYPGLLVPPLFLIFHWWLYRRALRSAGRWVFYYAASVYPLLMQFFQDQYFSLLSMWVQVAFWYWLLVFDQRHPSGERLRHA